MKLREEEKEIRKSKKVFIIADKTNNLCEMTPEKNQKLLHGNVAKTYKEAPQKVETSINSEVKNTAKSYNTDDRSHPACFLLNSKKTEFVEISKCILEELNNTRSQRL